MYSMDGASVPGFSSLSLSRPDSYSAAGRAADASTHVVKTPQPMLYFPESGLVTYEAPGLTGVAHMLWLEKRSSPKAVHTKPANSRTRATSPSRIQQQSLASSRCSSPGRQCSPQCQQQQQHKSRHNSPGRLSAGRQQQEQQQQQQQLSSAGQNCQVGHSFQSPVHGSGCAAGTGSLTQQLPKPQLQQHAPQCEQEQYFPAGAASEANVPDAATTAACDVETTLVSIRPRVRQARPHVDGLSGEESQVWAWKVTSGCKGTRPGSTAEQYNVSNTGSAARYSTRGTVGLGRKHPVDGARGFGTSVTHAAHSSTNGTEEEGNCASINLQARTQQHRSSSIAANDAGSSNAMSERLTLTQPYVFRWGGRIKHKHLGICEMHGAGGALSAAVASGGLSSSLPQLLQQQPSTQSTSCSSTATQLTAETAAAAAKIGAASDRLLKALDLRMKQHHPERRVKQLQRKAQLKPARLSSEWCSDSAADCIADEPICLVQEYLKL